MLMVKEMWRKWQLGLEEECLNAPVGCFRTWPAWSRTSTVTNWRLMAPKKKKKKKKSVSPLWCRFNQRMTMQKLGLVQKTTSVCIDYTVALTSSSNKIQGYFFTSSSFFVSQYTEMFKWSWSHQAILGITTHFDESNVLSHVKTMYLHGRLSQFMKNNPIFKLSACFWNGFRNLKVTIIVSSHKRHYTMNTQNYQISICS